MWLITAPIHARTVYIEYNEVEGFAREGCFGRRVRATVQSAGHTL